MKQDVVLIETPAGDPLASLRQSPNVWDQALYGVMSRMIIPDSPFPHTFNEPQDSETIYDRILEEHQRAAGIGPMSPTEAAANDRAYYDALEDGEPTVMHFNSLEDALGFLMGNR